MPPLVSIIINNHNYAAYLSDAIESALCQKYSNVQVIAVDDGSTDSSIEILGGFSSRIEWVSGPARGQASALNIGMAKARGEYVLFLDADDVLDEWAAEEIVIYWEKHPEVVHLLFQMEVVDALGNRTGRIKPGSSVSMLSQEPVDLGSLTLRCAYDLPWMPTSGNAFRTQSLLRIFPIPEQDYSPIGADWYLSHLSNLLGPVGFLPRVLSYYRVHGANRYELARPALDLHHIRQSVVLAQRTNRHLLRLANELGIATENSRVFSTSLIANQMILVKLDRASMPVTGERVFSLNKSGIQAVIQRLDVNILRKLFMMAWFLGMTVAPKRLAESLAILYLYPEARSPLVKLRRKAEIAPLEQDRA